ncbi:TauD/TfdA family dioxygenase [Micromonospora sp. CA-249363]|uniref:TauD/TfdA family dioxygenase n=1 Tax=Micromonospora sp. CA-249363 TaxID=3239963 RepID=UPI003D8F1A04
MSGLELVRAAQLPAAGYLVLRDLPLLTERGEVDADGILRLALAVGSPSARDGGRALWPVTPRAGDPESTFSVRAGAAALHTDAQYRPDPEDLVLLFVVRPARDGGDTLLLAATDAEAAVARASDLRALRAARWSWSVPAQFAAQPPFRAPVLPGDGTIRWRRDNLVACDRREHEVAERFAAAIAASEEIVQLRLAAGDAVIFDNRRMLHGRTAFTDPRRLLYRVRVRAAC